MLLEAHGIRVGYDLYGAGAATLALLHAYPFSRGQWRAQAEALARSLALRVVALDLTGCGESSDSADPITVERMADDARALLDALGAGRPGYPAIIGGLSLGGYVALAAMRRYPERVSGLILADTRASADTPEGKAGREATAQFVTQNGPGALFDRDVPKLLSNRILTRRPEIVAQARALAENNTSSGLAAVARGMALRPDATPTLPDIACPTLILVGDQDAITPVADARVLFERIPHTELEVIEDAGHLSNLERADLVTDRMATFLRERLGVAERA
ncbi:MAG TPA: alpha/beta fold hydrolase [Ktedonobacterales bacterium]|nr:alpha/beta fold hydrolase [Ktedonobacterales bacterium]